jgi:hypothetical protein
MRSFSARAAVGPLSISRLPERSILDLARDDKSSEGWLIDG